MTDKIKEAREALDDITCPSKHESDEVDLHGFLYTHELDTILRALTALEKLEAIDGKALGEAIEWADKNSKAVTMAIDEAKHRSTIFNAARAVAEIKGA